MEQYALRNKYPEFVFESFKVEQDFSGISIQYVYKLGEHIFTPSVKIPAESIRNQEINDEFLEYLCFNFGIINAINYYKLTCAPKFVIRAGNINDEQKAFFKKLFYNGLGEFMYVNNLNLASSDFMEIVCDETPSETPHFEIGNNFHGNIITVGGGKDSIVALETLQPVHNDNLCMQYNRNIYPQNQAALDSIHVAGYPTSSIINFNLTLDPLMLQLNQMGYYNGHIPFSSCLAFATIIMAYLNNKQYVVLSNESSANEGNTINGAGEMINHQYSKSYEFEKDFQDYCKKYLTDKIFYFSLLRPLNEYEIVQRFLRNRLYLPVFRSCNVGTKQNAWCGHCAKCLYVYIMLYPHVPVGELDHIFGHNLLDDPTLMPIFQGLIDPDTTKPFECVGTKEEINYSLKLAIEQADDLPFLLQQYKLVHYNPMQQFAVENYYDANHSVPEQFLKLLFVTYGNKH